MSNDLNRAEFIGRLVRDPELRHASTGTAMCSFTLACGWKTKEKEGTEFVRVVAYNKLAEIIAQYMLKGSQMFVSGRMSTREYEKDGVKRYSTEVIADQMQMLGHAKGAENKQEKQPVDAQLPDIQDDIPF
jgi:single-strand DNA-binding protein